eukprot:4700760-Pleurochrysis_carterae.AAC.1
MYPSGLKSQLHARRALSEQERGARPAFKKGFVIDARTSKKKSEVLQSGENGDGDGKDKTEEFNGAGGVGAKGSVSTVYMRVRLADFLKRLRHYLALTNVLVRPLPVLTSDRHVLRHIVSSRFSARGNLNRDLDVAAGRLAVLARAQLVG